MYVEVSVGFAPGLYGDDFRRGEDNFVLRENGVEVLDLFGIGKYGHVDVEGEARFAVDGAATEPVMT